MSGSIEARYPLDHALEDGARVSFSLMSPDDREALSKFIAGLSRTDLLYLQADLSKPENLERWLESMVQGKALCICCYDPARLVGYASVQTEKDEKHSGEIRVNINPGYRSRGLGRILISEIFFIAEQLKLNQITARMLSDQHGAKAAFRRLGFVEEQVMADYVKDASGVSRDLIVMSTRPN
jgi:RimJ/RimL family protein N-acetyltransferase